MDIRIQRDQAVWERETFTLKVRDDFDPYNEEHMQELQDKIDREGFDAADYYNENLCVAMEGLSTETVVTMPDGKEIEL